MRVLIFSVFGMMISMTSLAQNDHDWANFGKYAEANKKASPGAVVFMGNSITEGWVNTHPDFFTKNNFIGRGISGQVSSQMLVRFRADVIGLAPRTVVILAGTNDIARNNGYISLEHTLGNIVSMCELAKANGIRVVLCSVLPADHFGWRPELKPAEEILSLNKMTQQYAIRNNISYVDFHSALKDDKNGLPEKYAKDGVHPTPEGYEVMEKLILPALGKTDKKKSGSRKYLFSKG